MTAGNRTALYRSDVPARGDGTVSNRDTRAVLRELCAIAHHAGIAHTSVGILADRLGVSKRVVIRATQRLQGDGWVTRPVRGVGNRVNVDPRASTYVLRPMPDADGRMWPDPEWVGEQWPQYALTPRFLALSRANRAAVRMALHEALGAVDNSETGADDESNKVTALSQQGDSPAPPRQVNEKPTGPLPAGRVHPQAAARARGRMALVAADPPRRLP